MSERMSAGFPIGNLNDEIIAENIEYISHIPGYPGTSKQSFVDIHQETIKTELREDEAEARQQLSTLESYCSSSSAQRRHNESFILEEIRCNLTHASCKVAQTQIFTLHIFIAKTEGCIQEKHNQIPDTPTDCSMHCRHVRP